MVDKYSNYTEPYGSSVIHVMYIVYHADCELITLRSQLRGRQQLSDNIADSGGLLMAYRAYKKYEAWRASLNDTGNGAINDS